MGVKQVQFSYSSEWWDRKIKLDVTWRQIMEAGIKYFEGNKSINKKSSVKKDKPKKEVNEEFYLHLLPNDPSVFITL